MSQEITKGYKVTNANMQCRGYQYELNKAFKHEGSVSVCDSGFHFCPLPQHCFNYYDFDTNNRVFEIEASGQIETEGDKCACTEIKFIREIPWSEVLTIVNTGSNNTGHSNSGNRNSGDSNSGNRNSGNWNSGNSNSGNWNSGNRNSGNSNSGDSNSGNRNSGDSNSGNRNSGNWNSGNRNSGNRNSGDSNSGNRNSGNWNSGNSNSGNWNSGNRNSGDSNSGYRNSGAFCTDSDPILILFNKPSSMTVKQWESHPACQLMYSIDTTIWVPWSIMSEEEKKANPKFELQEGYLKTIPIKEAWSNFWHNLSDDKKSHFTSLENFDSNIFFEITGIKID